MPSNRKFKVTVLFIAIAILITIYISSSGRSTRSSDFYTRTADALALRESQEKDGKGLESDDAEVQKRLRHAQEVAKEAASKKAEEFHGEEIKKKGEKIKQEVDRKNAAEDAQSRIDEKIKQKPVDDPEKSPEDLKAEAELSYILKRSPIIIFSKSYCPFSKKAKDILLHKYNITPAPYVVELDEHELGMSLQNQLAHTTGRRTVPNVLVNGVSIGGGDDIEELHNSGKLLAKIEDLTGKKVQVKAV